MDGGQTDFDPERVAKRPPLRRSSWPRISDYWPDRVPPDDPADDGPGWADLLAGRAPDVVRYPSRPLPRPASPPPPGDSRLRLAVALAGVVVCVGLTALGLHALLPSGGKEIVASVPPPVEVVAPETSGPATPSVSPAVRRSTSPASRPPAGPAFSDGTLVLNAEVAEVDVTLGRTGAGPIRPSLPAGSGLTTHSTVVGTTVTFTAQPTAGPPGPRRVQVQLDERISWTIRMTGGVQTGRFTLTGGSVRAIDLAAGADTIDLALPRTTQALPIRMSGGLHTWRISTDGEEPVRVRVGGGAGEVTLYGRRHRGIAQGTQLTAGSGTGLEIDAVAGIGSLTVSAT